MVFEITRSIAVSPSKTDFGPILFAGELEKGIAVVKRVGFKMVDLSIRDPNDTTVQEAVKIILDNGMGVTTIATGQSYYNDGISLSHLNKRKRKMCISRMLAHIDLASKLNSFVTIGGIRGAGLNSKRIDLPSYFDNLKDSFSEIIPYAEKRNVILLLEPINRYETMLINTIKEAVSWIDEIGSSNLKILPDTFHMNIEENSMEDNLIIFGKYISYIHFADSNRLAPGWGHLNFKGITSVLKEIDFKGAVGVEILPRPGSYDAAVQAYKYLDMLFN